MTSTSDEIIGIQFSMLSPEEIKRNSVVSITSRDTYISQKPTPNGLFDSRMGVLEPGMICPTDGHTYINCPGYFGHIELARPVFFIQNLKDIHNILKCVCFKCSKLFIDKTKHRHIQSWSAKDRWEYVYKLASEVRRCGDKTEDGCGYKKPKTIKVDGIATINAIWEITTPEGETEKITSRLHPEIVQKIFKRISDEDVDFMGFSSVWSRPEWMICSVLPVAPPSVRPSVKMDAQQRSEDDLTHIYSNIIRFNIELMNKMKNKETHATTIESLTVALQYCIAMIYNNKIKGASPLGQRSGRPYQCIMDRLNGKAGRIRGNLMGKRVDFSARSVITGDPNLSVRQLGVPEKIAKNITKPVMVNARNRDFLMSLIMNGPDKYPGAKILEKKHGGSISLRYVDKSTIQLEPGDIVHRHMMDGDAVLFNRQPSLHRMSMMCHIAKVMRVGDTFRMNVACTKPYNADFDGDEMNLHMPQNVIAETELRHLAAIPYQIISPASNSPIISIFQDSLLGAYLFTQEGIRFDARTAMNLLMKCPKVNMEALMASGGAGNISSFAILSQILPPLSLLYKTKLYDEDTEQFAQSNNVLEIRNGVISRGQMEKSVLGGGSKGIIHRIFNDFGNFRAADFIDDLQSIINEYMKQHSFSVGISDLIANKETKQKIIDIIVKKEAEVQTLIEKVHLGIFTNQTAKSNMEEFEKSVNNLLNKATDESNKLGRKSLDKENRFLKIVNSGSKGSVLNITQMICLLGQQNIDGGRVPYGFENRTLPHFEQFDDSPEARGFVKHSYIEGLTAPEMFFHAMCGRIGLIDTAVKTSQTGYIQRRLIKGLEDLVVAYDMTVRNSFGKIVQFKYGDDGFDSAKIESQTVPFLTMTNAEIYLHFFVSQIDKKTRNSIFTPSVKFNPVETDVYSMKYTRMVIESRDIIAKNIFQFKNESSVKLPVALQSIIQNIQGLTDLSMEEIGKSAKVDISPLEAYELIEDYFENRIKSFHYFPVNPLFELLYYYYITPRELLVIRRFNRASLLLLLESIVSKYKSAFVSPGEMVGVIAGQSVGEPTTQMTLNTFHSSSGSEKNQTKGVMRIEELSRLTANPKTPTMTIYLKTEDQENQERATELCKKIEHTKLIDVVKTVEIYFDPIPNKTNIEKDQYLIEQFNEFQSIIDGTNENSEEKNQSAKSKWIIRLELNKEILLDKNITMNDIHFAISNSDFGNAECIYSDYNDDNLVFRIRMISLKEDKKLAKRVEAYAIDQTNEINLVKLYQESLLNNIILRGINKMKNVLPRKMKNVLVPIRVATDAGSQFEHFNKYESKDIWVLDTVGTNLIDILSLGEDIDYQKTYTNDIREVFNVLGIEATRQILYNEFVEVMENADVYINYHHLSLLCDRMTCSKDMTAIFRSGFNNDNIGTLAKASFEVHTEVFLRSAKHGEMDPMRGVSANVMCGQYGLFGTNSFSIVLDSERMVDFQMEEMPTTSTPIEPDQIQSLLSPLTTEIDNTKCSIETIQIENTELHTIQANGLVMADDNFDMGF